MILLTRLNGSRFYLNADHIQSVESTPDTHILLRNGEQYVATETATEVAERAIAYQQRVHNPYRNVIEESDNVSAMSERGGRQMRREVE